MRSLQMATEVVPAEEGEAEGCVQCQQGSKLVLFVTCLLYTSPSPRDS